MQNSNIGSSKLVLVAIFGLVLAGLTFLGTFITTQKASTPDPRANLRIKVDNVKLRPTLPPLIPGTVLIASPPASPSAITVEEVLTSSPTVSPSGL